MVQYVPYATGSRMEQLVKETIKVVSKRTKIKRSNFGKYFEKVEKLLEQYILISSEDIRQIVSSTADIFHMEIFDPKNQKAIEIF